MYTSLIKKALVFCVILPVIGCNEKGNDNRKYKLRLNEGSSMNRGIEDRVKSNEKFDSEMYKKTNYGTKKHIKKDGTEIFMMSFDEKTGGFLYEKPVKPYFYTVYKEFYPNRTIKRKEKSLGGYVKIGISEYYDEESYLLKRVDEDKKFGKVKPNDILLFLEKEGYINSKTGEGRENKDGSPKFELAYDNNIWYITIRQGRPLTLEEYEGLLSKDPNICVEPYDWASYMYEIDGNTGQVLKSNKE